MKNPQSRVAGVRTYIDARDPDAACRLARAPKHRGHTVFNIAAPTGNMRQPTDELVQRYLKYLLVVERAGS